VTNTLSMKTRVMMVVAALVLALLSASAVNQNALALPRNCVERYVESCGGADLSHGYWVVYYDDYGWDHTCVWGYCV
jgi:hypothetical protein